MNPTKSVPYFLAVLALAATLLGCQTDQAQEAPAGQPLHINLLNDDVYSEKAAEFIGGYRVLLLQEPDTANLLTQVNEAIIHGDKLIVRDASGPAVKAYDTTGRYLFQYGRKGQGPGEYWDLQYSDIEVMPQLGELWLFSNRQLSILRYQLGTGAFLEAHRFNFYPFKFMAVSEDEIFFFINGNKSEEAGVYNLLKSNLAGEISRKYSPVAYLGMMFGNTGFFHNGFYCRSYSDSVFQLVNDELVPRYVFVTGDAANKALPPGALGKNRLGNLFHDVGDYCVFNYVRNQRMGYFLYKKSTGKALRFKKIGEDGFSWILRSGFPGTDRRQQALLVNIDAESLPGLLAYFKAHGVAAQSPLPSSQPTTGQVLVYVYLK
jgi:hypothetical protein